MRTNKHETAVKKVKADHKATKLKQKDIPTNMGRTAKKPGKHNMEALTQEAGMRTPKRSKY